MGASRAACDVCIFIAFANKQGNSKFNLESCLVLNLTGYSMLLINRRMKITSRRRFQFAYSLIFPRLPFRHCWPGNNNLRVRTKFSYWCAQWNVDSRWLFNKVLNSTQYGTVEKDKSAITSPLYLWNKRNLHIFAVGAGRRRERWMLIDCLLPINKGIVHWF